MLKLKEHYEGQASSLEADVQRNQQDLDRIYLQAAYANSEAGYALGHTVALPALKRADINKIEAFLNSDEVPQDIARTALELSHQAQVALDASTTVIEVREGRLAVLTQCRDTPCESHSRLHLLELFGVGVLESRAHASDGPVDREARWIRVDARCFERRELVAAVL